MYTLRQHLTKQNSTIEDQGYDTETLDSEITLTGHCQDGNEKADVYSVACGGYHISSQASEQWHDGGTDELDGFVEVLSGDA